jgi:hypothetical protein
MSTAFLITFPLMFLAIVLAVGPILVMSIREHRPATGQNSRIGTSPPRAPSETLPVAGNPDGEAQAAVAALEEATFAVNRLRARREFTTGAGVDESLCRASDDLHHALVSLGDAGR